MSMIVGFLSPFERSESVTSTSPIHRNQDLPDEVPTVGSVGHPESCTALGELAGAVVFSVGRWWDFNHEKGSQDGFKVYFPVN